MYYILIFGFIIMLKSQLGAFAKYLKIILFGQYLVIET